MDAGLLVMSTVGVTTVVSLPVYKRSIQNLRQGDEEWRTQWRALDRERRRAIMRTMRRGDALRDPEDAELGIRAARQFERVRRAMRPLERIGTVGLLALFVGAVISDTTFLIVVAAAGILVTWGFGAASWWQRRRFRRSVEATRDLHGEEDGR